MQSNALGHTSPLEDANGISLEGRARYRAICLTCGAASGEMAGQAAAMQWSERHRGETSFPVDVVIESTLTLPSGTLGRFFQAA